MAGKFNAGSMWGSTNIIMVMLFYVSIICCCRFDGAFKEHI